MKIRRTKPERNSMLSARESRTDVDIVYSKITRHAQRVEHIILYGFVHDKQGRVTGYTLSCSVKWRTDDYSLNSGDQLARNYFKKLVSNHVDDHLSITDAALEMIFTDPDLDAPIGVGSGNLQFQMGFIH